jgi:hypothetical protein
VSLCIPSSSQSPDHDLHCTIYYLGYPLGRIAGLKHRQVARHVGVIITTGRIRRTLVNKINLLVDSPRSIEASRLALVKAESIFPTPHFRLLRHISRLVVDYFDNATRPGASARRAAHRRLLCLAQARRQLLRLRRASGCLGTSRGPSCGTLSTTPCAATLSCGHASSTSATPCIVTTCLTATLALLRVRHAPP